MTRDRKHISREQKKLIVLHNYATLQTCMCIMRELKDASTDIIIVSNEMFCKEAIAKDIDKHFSQGCNIIEVTNLPPIGITQRLVYRLLEKNGFVARDADHIVFILLSEYSRGSATVVHMLTSLMQKCDDNSRTGFELSKQQLKFHLAHLNLLSYYHRQWEVQVKNVSYTTVKTSSVISNTTQPSIRVETKQDLIIHPLHLYINDFLSNIFSLPANQLLNTLVITGPISLPLFYVEELSNIVTDAVIRNEKKMMQELQEFIPESPMNQLVKGGVIRNSCYPLVYHKDLDPKNLISNIQLVFIPKLICDAVKYQMDDTDKVLSTICAQRALENLLNNNEVDLIQLHYLLILCNQLHNICTQEIHDFGEELLITDKKLMLIISQRYKFT